MTDTSSIAGGPSVTPTAVNRGGTARSSDPARRELWNASQERLEAQVIRLGDREIDPGCAPLIVAEIGVNHNGSVAEALRLIEAAVEAGAEAVKFQWFRAESLASRSAAPAAYQQAKTPQADQQTLLRNLELGEEDFAQLRDRCAALGVLFIITPFGAEELERAAALKPAALKIGSGDVTDDELRRAAAASGLPVILSTGASTVQELDAAVADLLVDGAGPLILLHCVSTYPTPIEAANLHRIGALQRRYSVPVGFSDHTTSVDAGGWATAAGACVVEKHFTLDAAADGPDHAASLEPAAFAEYARQARHAFAALGSGVIDMAPEESDVRTAARKSVVAAQLIPAGSVIDAAMLTVKRPGTGLPPSERGDLVGRRTLVDVPADTLLAWDMVE
jgi:N,N'-diacetyllegionaminate synthase